MSESSGVPSVEDVLAGPIGRVIQDYDGHDVDGIEWFLLDSMRQHRYDLSSGGTKPTDPGWHPCSCGRWEGYWSGWQPHVAAEMRANLAPRLAPALASVLAEARAEALEQAADERAARKIAGDAADRFRDVLSEVLGLNENPGDDALVATIRERHGKTGPEPTRWRDFCTSALAHLDQINASDRTDR